VSRLFGEIRQMGYVVRDIEAAMHHWTSVLGIGPFFYFPRVVALDARYRGEAVPFEVAIALANSGPMQIELMCQLNDTPSAHRDFLAEHGEGLHHLAYWTDSFEDKLAGARAAGYEVWQQGAIGSRDNRYAYLSTQAHAGTIASRDSLPASSTAEWRCGPIVELSEVSGMKGKLFGHIAEVCASWDGNQPVRKL
jgi:hypothetical protein